MRAHPVIERPGPRALLELLDIGEDDRLLDAGTSGVLRELARRRDRPKRALGLDRSPEMLASAGALPPAGSCWSAIREASPSRQGASMW